MFVFRVHVLLSFVGSERLSREVDVVFKLTVHLLWFECVEFTGHEPMTLNHALMLGLFEY